VTPLATALRRQTTGRRQAPGRRPPGQVRQRRAGAAEQFTGLGFVTPAAVIIVLFGAARSSGRR